MRLIRPHVRSRAALVAAAASLLGLAAPQAVARAQAVIKVNDSVSVRFGILSQTWADWSENVRQDSNYAQNIFQRRIRFLVRRLDRAEVVDPSSRAGQDDEDRVYFGATVDVVNAKGEPRTVSIVGVDEIDTARGYISWVSPMARALIKAREGDTVTLQTPGGAEELEIAAVRYVPLDTGQAAAKS